MHDADSKLPALSLTMHPTDKHRASAAANAEGMSLEEFCALAIHRATVDAEQRRGNWRTRWFSFAQPNDN